MTTSLPTVLSDLIPFPQVLDNRRTKDVTLVVGGALFTAVAAQIVIHLGFTPVPITGQTFAVLAVGSTLGARRAMASQMLYWMLGAVGLPFYANGASGWSTASGATAGYFFGFILASGLVGWFADQRNDRNDDRRDDAKEHIRHEWRLTTQTGHLQAVLQILGLE